MHSASSQVNGTIEYWIIGCEMVAKVCYILRVMNLLSIHCHLLKRSILLIGE